MWNLIYWSFWLFVQLLYWPSFKGKKHDLDKTQCIIVGNHSSFFDPIFMTLFYRNRNLEIIGKKELFAMPVIKHVVKTYNVIPLDRCSTDLTAAKLIIQELNAGKSIGVFPEATRVKEANAELHVPKPALIQMAVKKNLPIVLASFGSPIKLFRGKKHYFGDMYHISTAPGKSMAHAEAMALTRFLLGKIYEKQGVKYINPSADSDAELLKETFLIKME